MSTLLADPRPTTTPPTPGLLPHVELPGLSWAGNGFYNHLRRHLPDGTTVSKDELVALMRHPGPAGYKALRDELHTAGALETLPRPGGGMVIVFHDLHPHVGPEPEMPESRTSENRAAAIKYIPKGCTSPPTHSRTEKPAAKPHRPAPPAMAPAAPSGETAGQQTVSTGGDKSGDNSRTPRTNYATHGWKVVREVQARGPWLAVKPRRGTQIGHTIRMMVEDFGLTPDAATDLLITRSLSGETVLKAAVEATLSTGQTQLPVRPSPAPTEAPAPVDVVDRTDAHQGIETQMAQAKLPDGVAAAVRSLVMQRTELLRYRNFAVRFYREVCDAGLSLTDGQLWAAAQILVDEPGWDYSRIAAAMRAARG